MNTVCTSRSDIARHVVFATDDRGFEPLQVAVYSLLRSADPAFPLRVSVLTGCRPLDSGHRAAIARLAARFPFAVVECIDVDETTGRHLAVFADDALWGRMAWARCLIGELFPEAHGNIVYLDIDTFVCEDLDALYRLDLTGKVLAAVPEEHREEGRQLDPVWKNGLLDPRAERYCNSGVLVMNVDAFRDERLLSRIGEWYRLHRAEIIRPDQDTLNCLFWNRIAYLHPRYNHCDGWLERQAKEDPSARLWRGNSPREVLEAILNPVILHFWGSHKPWKWNHRPEGARYEAAMREAGLLEGDLPGTTPLRRIVRAFFALYHRILRKQVERRFAWLTF